METQELTVENVENRYNKSLLKTVATLYSLHNELLVQLANLTKYSEANEIGNNITDEQITNLLLAESISSIDPNAKDLIELIDLLKIKMNTLLNRTLQ